MLFPFLCRGFPFLHLVLCFFFFFDFSSLSSELSSTHFLTLFSTPSGTNSFCKIFHFQYRIFQFYSYNYVFLLFSISIYFPTLFNFSFYTITILSLFILLILLFTQFVMFFDTNWNKNSILFRVVKFFSFHFHNNSHFIVIAINF